MIRVYADRFSGNINIVRVRNIRLTDHLNMLRHLVPLLKARVKRIEDNNHIHFGTVGEVWPVEAIGHVIFINRTLDMLILINAAMIIWTLRFWNGLRHKACASNMLVRLFYSYFVTLLNINHVNVEEFSYFHNCF